MEKSKLMMILNWAAYALYAIGAIIIIAGAFSLINSVADKATSTGTSADLDSTIDTAKKVTMTTMAVSYIMGLAILAIGPILAIFDRTKKAGFIVSIVFGALGILGALAGTTGSLLFSTAVIIGALIELAGSIMMVTVSAIGLKNL